MGTQDGPSLDHNDGIWLKCGWCEHVWCEVPASCFPMPVVELGTTLKSVTCRVCGQDKSRVFMAQKVDIPDAEAEV